MKIGYIRVSTTDQNLDLQLDALQSAGCNKIHKDIASGAKTDRVGLSEILKYIRKGDTLIVWRLDKLGRCLRISFDYRGLIILPNLIILQCLLGDNFIS